MMDRGYTPYQRRQVISKIAERDNISVVDAAQKFKAMEFENPSDLKKLCQKFDEEPVDDTPIKEENDEEDN